MGGPEPPGREHLAWWIEGRRPRSVSRDDDAERSIPTGVGILVSGAGPGGAARASARPLGHRAAIPGVPPVGVHLVIPVCARTIGAEAIASAASAG